MRVVVVLAMCGRLGILILSVQLCASLLFCFLNTYYEYIYICIYTQTNVAVCYQAHCLSWKVYFLEKNEKNAAACSLCIQIRVDRLCSMVPIVLFIDL